MALFNLKEDFRVGWYPKSHLTAPDLGDGTGRYKSVIVKVKEIKIEMLMKAKTQKKEPTPVAFFEKGSKYLILSNAVCRGMFEATGKSVPAEWIGQTVELWVETGVRAFGKVTDQVRVRAAKGHSLSGPPPELHDLDEVEDEYIDEGETEDDIPVMPTGVKDND